MMGPTGVLLVGLLSFVKAGVGAIPHSSFDEETCKSWGFDPSQLSCDSCELLLVDENGAPSTNNPLGEFYDECKICCQKWKTNDFRDHAEQFKSAKFIVYQRPMRFQPMGGGDPMGGGEVEMYLQSKEFGELVKRKGGDDVIRMETGPPMAHSAQLFLFRDALQTEDGPGDDEADETITLSNWKKDDVRDLIANVISDASTLAEQ